MKVAKVAVSAANYSIDKLYDYLVPESMEGSAQPGIRVLLPFGNGNRRVEGIILKLAGESGFDKLKPIMGLLDTEPIIDAAGIKLALWLRERCFCTFYETLRAMIPTGVWFSMVNSYQLSADRETAYLAAKKEAERAVLDYFFAHGGQCRLEELEQVFENPTPVLKKLVKSGVLQTDARAVRGVKDKTVSIAELAVSAEDAMAYAASKKSSSPLQYSVIETMCAVEAVSVKELCYFTGASMTTIRNLEKKGILCLTQQEVLRRPAMKEVEKASEITLSPEQEKAFSGLSAHLDKAGAALLFGVTGSGKTSVYIKLIYKVLSLGKTALVLVPEIALTPQLLSTFASHFGDKVAVMHSALRVGERYDEWKRIRRGEATVVVGTRSAVFAPLQKLGLIVIDEEQEQSYKSENAPRYHARDVAKYRCVQDGALLLLASATPSVESYHSAVTGQYQLFTLKERYNRKNLPHVIIHDMREELKDGSWASIGASLRNELEVNLKAGEQSILFINRRGASNRLICTGCGYIPHCPRCSVSLTYHSANSRLMCHYCGYSERLPDICPVCAGKLRQVGAGTQKVEEELSGLFPDTKILRMDTDVITATRSHEAILETFVKEKIPILVGTQMVAKGLDFENVTLVGVIAADMSLYADDFRANERTFSLITQVVGRAGRGEKIGRAVIQTYSPDNEIINLAARQNYETFFSLEMAAREARECPPVRDIVSFMLMGTEEGAVLRASQRLKSSLIFTVRKGLAQSVLGPAPAVISKINNRYRYRILMICKNTSELRRYLAELLISFRNDKSNKGVNINVDINAFE